MAAAVVAHEDGAPEQVPAASGAEEAEARALAASIRRALAGGALEDAFGLVLRAAAHATLSLAEERALYADLMAQAARRPDLPPERFHAMARHGGWDAVIGAGEGTERVVRQEVQHRLEADAWYGDLELAARRFGRPKYVDRAFGRNTALYARLFLGRSPRWICYFMMGNAAGIGARRWMRRQLGAYERHRPWLDGRLAPHLAWIGEMFPPQGRRPPWWFMVLWFAALFLLVTGVPIVVGVLISD